MEELLWIIFLVGAALLIVFISMLKIKSLQYQIYYLTKLMSKSRDQELIEPTLVQILDFNGNMEGFQGTRLSIKDWRRNAELGILLAIWGGFEKRNALAITDDDFGLLCIVVLILSSYLLTKWVDQGCLIGRFPMLTTTKLPNDLMRRLKICGAGLYASRFFFSSTFLFVWHRFEIPNLIPLPTEADLLFGQALATLPIVLLAKCIRLAD